jgi:hypothetical protein
MQPYQQAHPVIEVVQLNPMPDTENLTSEEKQISGHDIVQNVDLKDALIRFGITLVLPMLMLVIDKQLVIFTAPVMTYLFATAITRFCVIKYVWRRYVSHKSTHRLTAYGQDSNYPEESHV